MIFQVCIKTLDTIDVCLHTTDIYSIRVSILVLDITDIFMACRAIPMIAFPRVRTIYIKFKTMGGESYTVIKIKMSITLLIKSTFLSVNSRTVL